MGKIQKSKYSSVNYFIYKILIFTNFVFLYLSLSANQKSKSVPNCQLKVQQAVQCDKINEVRIASNNIGKLENQEKIMDKEPFSTEPSCSQSNFDTDLSNRYNKFNLTEAKKK